MLACSDQPLQDLRFRCIPCRAVWLKFRIFIRFPYCGMKRLNGVKLATRIVVGIVVIITLEILVVLMIIVKIVI